VWRQKQVDGEEHNCAFFGTRYAEPRGLYAQPDVALFRKVRITKAGKETV
jgi:hypothetical protein